MRSAAPSSASSATACVRRFELGQISSTVPASTSLRSASSLPAAAMPWPMRDGFSFSSTASTPGAAVYAVSPVCTVVPSAAARARANRSR